MGGAGATRGEKKSRKAMAKLGMKPFPGINRVTMKKSKTILFVIAKPDVYKSPTSETYIIFGEAKIEDLSSSQQNLAAEQFKPQPARQAPAAASSKASVPEGDVDETGVDAKDIDLVVGQAGCTRAQAVKALKNNDNDIVNAIMELTM